MAPTIRRIYGPPGCGKTSFLLARVQDELSRGLYPGQIVFTSFTKAAAEEGKERARVSFQDYGSGDFPFFSTIHSICYRLLYLGRLNVFERYRDEFGKQFGYSFGKEPRSTGQDLADPGWRTLADAYENFWEFEAHSMVGFEEAYRRFMRGAASTLPSGYDGAGLMLYKKRKEEFKRERGLWEFSDMLEGVLERSLCPPGMEVLLSDETQDLSPLLAAVIRLWSSRAQRVWIAGDPEQCLYSWSAADPAIMMDWPVDETVVLRQSHRCQAAVRDLAMVPQRRMRARYEGDSFLPAPGAGEVRRPGEWPRVPLAGGTTFWLARTRRLLQGPYAWLIRQGIPFKTLRGPRGPLEREEGRLVQLLERLRQGRVILAEDLRLCMRRLPSGRAMPRGAKAAVTRAAVQGGPALGLSALVRERWLTGEFAQAVAAGRWWDWVHMLPSDMTYLEQLQRAGQLGERPRITLSTIHGVKGMEADRVVLGLGMGTLPARTLRMRPDEEHRVFYTAVTRARSGVDLLSPLGVEAYPL